MRKWEGKDIKLQSKSKREERKREIETEGRGVMG